jgi:hypothetical protein
MDDISNKTLAILLVFAMAISLGGTLISLNRLRVTGTEVPGITGFGTGTGIANLSITSDTTISILTNIIDFGTGVVNITLSCNNATLASSHNDTNWTAVTNVCWSNATVGGGGKIEFSSEDIVIRNDGSVNVTLQMASSDDTAATFIGGTTAGGPLYQYRAHSNETDACDNANNQTWHDINSSNTMAVCDKLKADNSQDEVRVSIKVRIPSDAAGYKEDTLTFTSG